LRVRDGGGNNPIPLATPPSLFGGFMEFHFTKDDSIKYGIDMAIMLYNLKFWVRKNKANGRNFFEGHYWTYNSYSSFEKLFPFWNIQKIGRILREMEEKGIIRSANLNKNKSDRSKWYCIVDESFMNDIEEESSSSSDSSDLNNDSSKMNNELFKNEQCINTYIIPYNKTSYTKENIKEKKFQKPKVEEIQSYCKEIGANINAEQFYDYYESKGWMIGKNKMKDWKAAVRTWKRNNSSSSNKSVANEFLELGRK